jgi:hypothetical protein
MQIEWNCDGIHGVWHVRHECGQEHNILLTCYDLN